MAVINIYPFVMQLQIEWVKKGFCNFNIVSVTTDCTCKMIGQQNEFINLSKTSCDNSFLD